MQGFVNGFEADPREDVPARSNLAGRTDLSSWENGSGRTSRRAVIVAAELAQALCFRRLF